MIKRQSFPALKLMEKVGFSGNGYLELPGSLMQYDQLTLEPAIIALAINTHSDGVLLYQHQEHVPPYSGDFVLLRGTPLNYLHSKASEMTSTACG